MMLGALGLILWFDDWAQYKTRGWMEARYADQHFRGGVGGIGLLMLLAFILPIATREFWRVISLPIWPGMTAGDLDRVVAALGSILAPARR